VAKNSSEEEETQVKFGDIFPDIQEDKFYSSDDDEEVKKNHRLERFG
jgi:hypothetical protein